LEYIRQYLGGPAEVDVDALKAENEELKARVDELQAKLEQLTVQQRLTQQSGPDGNAAAAESPNEAK
jgi:cell division septum initiation protein DivIVA